MANIKPISNTNAVYGELLAQFQKQIKENHNTAGSMLPSEKEIAQQHGISRWAVREMLARLAEEGLVIKIAGKGTMVREREERHVGRTPVVIDVIIDNTNKLYANEYATNFLQRIEMHSQLMRRPFRIDCRLADFTGQEDVDREMLRQVRADASVIMPFSRQCRGFLEMLGKGDRLIVALAAELSSKTIPQVFVDDVDGVRQGTRYLLHLGHRRIAMLVPTEYQYRNGHSRLRQDAFMAVMRQAGCIWSDRMVQHTETEYGPIRSVVTQWMQCDTPPTAIFVGDGNWLSPVKVALDLLGKRVPADISLISYDDVLESRVYEPPVTVVRQPIDTAVRRLFETILDHLEGRPEARLQQRVAPELIVRGSSCPPGFSMEGI
ncbi:MAG: GntR family transcriptional regulator [Phycisphaerales bacterium]|jgi:DNA-binding LacI/PurR family transcriptional regulator|nr:GntR family transcriptional regulator [Phycisphaerales bacterium]